MIQKTAYDVAVLPVEEPILRTMPLVMKDRRGLSTAAVFLEIREINSCNSLHSVYISQIHSVILHLNDRILHETRGEQMEPAQRIRRIRMIENCASHSRYFSDELDAQNFYQKEEQMFDIFLCIWYTIFMKKDMFTINKNGLSYGRGYVYSLQYHLVWCTKYRKKVLKDGIDVECKEMLESLAQEYKFQILAMEVMPDHIHLLVDCRPQFYISDMIKIMKGNLARQMFLLHPELKKELWGEHL
ncbi:MAG: IS200/IS605 family transposase [Fusicatenibacter saccharivorans]